MKKINDDKGVRFVVFRINGSKGEKMPVHKSMTNECTE
jgi:hypothetical protein